MCLGLPSLRFFFVFASAGLVVPFRRRKQDGGIETKADTGHQRDKGGDRSNSERRTKRTREQRKANEQQTATDNDAFGLAPFLFLLVSLCLCACCFLHMWGVRHQQGPQPEGEKSAASLQRLSTPGSPPARRRRRRASSPCSCFRPFYLFFSHAIHAQYET